MLFLIVFLPLLGFFCGILFGRFLGFGVCIITTTFVFLSFLCSLTLFLFILNKYTSIKLILGSWIWVDSLNIEWSFCFDSLTVLMLIVVTFVSALVHLYSIEYMSEDPHLVRFMSYLSLFTFFMLILVTSSNFLQMFVGWEGVGLSSFLLINFWFTRIQANKSAIKAMLINRIGDFFILIGLFLIFFVFNSLDYDVVFILSKSIKNLEISLFGNLFFINDIICLLLFFGAMGKSAQIGLHVWLPDAMEGPTPVSALIHAATMVTAGIFLITRCSFLFEMSPGILNVIIFIGSLTAFFASTTGFFQNDIKKVIAYSTCSQLGYMVFACGLSGYDVGVFHLFNHAFFKALLFLCAGSIIHAVSNEQDMRKFGGLRQLLPLSYSGIFIGSLALTGFPFLSGFYSKDAILELAFAKYTTLSHFSFFLGSIGALFTSFYSTRVVFLVFLTNANGNRFSILNAHEGSWKMSLPLVLLSLLSIFIGFLTKDLFVGIGTDFWNSSIYILPENYYMLDVEFLNIYYKLLPFFFSMVGIILGVFFYGFNIDYNFHIKKSDKFRFFYRFFNKKWYFDKLYNESVSGPFLYYSFYFSYINLDRGLLEIFGPQGISSLIEQFSNSVKFLQSGNIFQYLLIVFFVLNITTLTLIFIK